MSDASTRRMISMYMDEATPPGFFSGQFVSPPVNFHNSEMVELDIIRDDEDIAVVVQDLTVGARQNEDTKYVNKGFIPPVLDEEGTITAYNLIKRAPGDDPFQDPQYGRNATRQAFRIFRRLEAKIRRTVELMGSQVMQTGVLTLVDSSGTTLYTLDFQPKATHIATVTTEWSLTDGSAGDPLGDLEAFADVIRTDGKHDPDRIVFGTSAWQRFTTNTKVQKLLDNRNMRFGEIAPQIRGGGATFQGYIIVGGYRFEMWSYHATYKHPQTGVTTKYLHPEKLVMRASTGRLDLTWGAIPRLPGANTQGAMEFLPPRMSSSRQGLDLSVFAWRTPDGKHLKVSCGTRPLTIPTAIDTFGCLDVTP